MTPIRPRNAQHCFCFGNYALGAGLIVLSAIGWAAYAMAQKQLLTVMSSASILLVVYTGSAILLIPMAAPESVLNLSPIGFWLLIFSAANTLIAYGSFSEAMAHWEASRVSAVLALTPIATLLFVWLASSIWPHLMTPEGLDGLAIFGAILVVTGSMMPAA